MTEASDPNDQVAWLEAMIRLVELLDSATRTFDETAERHGWKPNKGSQAEAERNHELTGNAVAMTVTLGHVSSAAAARDALRALRLLLLQYPPFAFAPYPLIRQALECIARAWWLWDPRIDPLERAARGLTEMVYSMRQRLGLPGIDEQPLVEALERVATMAGECGLSVRRRDGLPSKIGDVHRLDGAPLMGALFEVEPFGTWVYKTLSASAHVNIIELWAQLSDSPDGEAVVLDVSDEQLRLALIPLLQGWWSASQDLVDYMGWNDGPWQTAARSAVEVMQGLVSDFIGQEEQA